MSKEQMRLTKILSTDHGLSRRSAKTFIKEGKIRVNGRICTHDADLTGDEAIQVQVERPDLSFQLGDYLVKETENIVFLYKPPFMHSERHTPEDPLTVEDIARHSFPNFTLISRLDFETDGIICAIRNGYSVQSISKRYIAIVSPLFPPEATLSAHLDSDNVKKVRVNDKGVFCESRFILKQSFKTYSLVETKITEAARHQLRALLSYSGHPIVGDKLYSGSEFQRLLLHCAGTSIDGHEVNSPHEENFSALLKTLD